MTFEGPPTDLRRRTVIGARAALAGAGALSLQAAIAPAGAPRPSLFPWDKAEHFTAFVVLTLLAMLAFPRRSLFAITLALSVFGAAIEGVQALPFVHRDADLWDWWADTSAPLLLAAAVEIARLRAHDQVIRSPGGYAGRSRWLIALAIFVAISGVGVAWERRHDIARPLRAWVATHQFERARLNFI